MYIDKIISLLSIRSCQKICPKVHIFFYISANNADIFLKFKILLYHHLTNSSPIYIFLTFILTKLFPFLDLENVKKFPFVQFLSNKYRYCLET